MWQWLIVMSHDQISWSHDQISWSHDQISWSHDHINWSLVGIFVHIVSEHKMSGSDESQIT